MRAEERLLKLISMADGNEPSKESRAMAASLAAGIGYVNLSGNGLSWTQIKQIGASFSQIKKLKYRWDMIESR